jgi:hypothetical protein
MPAKKRSAVGKVLHLKATPPIALLRETASIADLKRAPYTVVGCSIHKTHKPTPNSSELHHVFPLGLQAKVWADVDNDRPSTAHDRDRVPLCGTGHTDVHVAIDALLAGRAKPRGIGVTELALAKEAVRLYNAARPQVADIEPAPEPEREPNEG